jgi:hypothetical protein
MRTISIMLTATFAICLADVHAFAAGNPDRTYYRGAGACGGAAYCSYRANKKVRAPKTHRSESITLHGVLPV